MEGAWSITWNAFFTRTKVTLERKLKVEPGLLERLLAEKTCKMNCDFEVKLYQLRSSVQSLLVTRYCNTRTDAEVRNAILGRNANDLRVFEDITSTLLQSSVASEVDSERV